MIEAATPHNEEERLSRLKRLNVLNTPIEERFERITRIVCRVLDVPIAAISLIDKDRQWFKSIQGIAASETPRNVAFCSHAILKDETLVVPDALKDERFSGNPLVTEDPSIRFYAGCPIDLGDGLRIGTLCAIDQKSREMSSEDLELLRDLAEIVKSEITSSIMSDGHTSLINKLDEAERGALIDPLTRQWNSQGASELLTREWASSKRESAQLSIAILSLNEFKEITDEYGHQTGDECLKHFSKIVMKCIRGWDILCRWGDEGFMIILPKCRKGELVFVLDRIQEALARSPFKASDGDIILSCSIGGCTIYPTFSRENQENLIKIVGNCLDVAKKSGKSCNIIAPSQPCIQKAFG